MQNKLLTLNAAIYMKIKYLTSLIFATALSCVAYGQYGVSKETYKVAVQKFPMRYVEPNERTYCIKIDNKIQNIYSDSYIVNEIEIPGWTEATEEEAFLLMNITVQQITNIGTELKDNRTEKQTKDGLQIDHHYFPTLKYSFNIKCNFKTKFETFERKSSDGASIVKFYPIKADFPSPEAANTYIKENMESIHNDIAKDDLNYMINEIQKAVKEKYIATPTEEDIMIAYLIDKDSPFKDEMEAIKTQIEQCFSNIEADKDLGVARSCLASSIEKFQNIAGELSNTDIAQRKAKEEVIKNLAAINYILEDFEQCQLYSQILKDTFKSKDGDKYIRLINTLKTDFEKHHQTSRHFTVE